MREGEISANEVDLTHVDLEFSTIKLNISYRLSSELLKRHDYRQSNHERFKTYKNNKSESF